MNQFEIPHFAFLKVIFTTLNAILPFITKYKCSSVSYFFEVQQFNFGHQHFASKTHFTSQKGIRTTLRPYISPIFDTFLVSWDLPPPPPCYPRRGWVSVSPPRGLKNNSSTSPLPHAPSHFPAIYPMAFACFFFIGGMCPGAPRLPPPLSSPNSVRLAMILFLGLSKRLEPNIHPNKAPYSVVSLRKFSIETVKF